MTSVAKEDLEALRKKKYRLYFILGGPGSGKGTQCEKIVNEFKYIHISTGDLVREEIKNNTPLGSQCLKYSSKGELVPFELIVNILIKAILKRKGNNFLIDGFPRTMEQALYLEKNMKEISVILNISAKEETLIQRMTSRGKMTGRKDDLDENTIKNRIKEFLERSFPVIEFYEKYGVVKQINSEQDVNSVYHQVRESLFPDIYCIIGKKYSGKTELATAISHRMNSKLIDFNDFIKDNKLNGKDDEFIITSLINQLKEIENGRVILENFPLKKEHYSLFVKNYKAINKIIYLNVDNNIASERMKKMGKESPRFVGCSQLNKELAEFENKKEVIELLKKKQGLIEIDVNNHLILVAKELISYIEPSILIFKSDERNDEMKNGLIKHFCENLGYKIIDVTSILKETVNRSGKLGMEIEEYQNRMQHIPNNLICEALKPILFKEYDKKYILINYPTNKDEVAEFENKICKIQRLVYVCNKRILEMKNDLDLYRYFKKENRLFVYDRDEINEYLINDIQDKNPSFNIVYGLPKSGKTVFNNYLSKSYDHNMIDLNLFITKIKEEKAGPEGDVEGVVVTPEILFNELSLHLKKIPKNKKICIDNLINPVITNVSQISDLINVIGTPRFFFNLNCHELPLKDRYKVQLGKEEGGDLNEEETEEFNKSLEIHRQIVEIIKTKAFRTIDVNTSYSEEMSKRGFDMNFGRNFIVFKHEYDINIENTLLLLAIRFNSLYINVPELIYKQFYLNNEWATKLERTYHKKNLKNYDNSIEDRDYQIYHKYNPIHFDDNMVSSLIIDYISLNSKEIESKGNFILLTGYFNYDLYNDNELPFNLPLYEVGKILNLGFLNSFIQIYSGANIETEEILIREKILEPVKIAVQKDKLDISVQEGEMEEKKDEEPVEEGDPEGKPKFKPELFEWSWYDGKPRNYIQVLKKLTKIEPSNLKEYHVNMLHDDLYNLVRDALSNNGILQLIRITK